MKEWVKAEKMIKMKIESVLSKRLKLVCQPIKDSDHRKLRSAYASMQSDQNLLPGLNC